MNLKHVLITLHFTFMLQKREKGEFTPCVYVYFCLIRYAVVTNVVKIIPSSECLFLCPFCICSAWERNGKRANSHRVYMYTFVLSESKRRVKPSADVRVVIPSKKKHNADYTGYTWCRVHFGSSDQRFADRRGCVTARRFRRSPLAVFLATIASQKRRARVTRTVRDFTGQTVAC